MLDIENVRSLIYNIKGYNIGFKVRVPSKVHELIEELCAFANVNGGYLFIGEDNNEKVIGTNFENNKRSAIQGSIRETPLTIFKKNIINVLSHRGYYEQEATITIEMFDDKVEVSNPEGLSPIVARDFGHKNMTHIPLIFRLFSRMHLVERGASCILCMYDATKETKLHEPEFHTDEMFTVLFKRSISNKNGTLSDTVNPKEQKVLNIKQYPGLNLSKIAELVSKSVPTSKRYLNSLMSLQLTEFRRAHKAADYYINK